MLEKGKKAQVGEIREWGNGRKMRKTANGWEIFEPKKAEAKKEAPKKAEMKNPIGADAKKMYDGFSDADKKYIAGLLTSEKDTGKRQTLISEKFNVGKMTAGIFVGYAEDAKEAPKKEEKKAEPKKDEGTVDSYVEEMAGGPGSAVDHVIEVVLNAQGSKNTKANVKYLFEESGMDATEFIAEVEVELKNEYKLAPSEEMTEKEFVDDFLPSIKAAIK